MLMSNNGEKKPNSADRVPSKSVMAFLQARMGSTRLPGKVLMKIREQSILERAVRRLKTSSVVDEVAVLTTCRDEDDAVVKEAQRLGARVHRGPEQDVLLRFYEGWLKFRPDVIIRATADNPLIDIDSIGRIAHGLCSGGFDLCMEKGLPYGSATEAITADALAKVNLIAKEPKHREHVTLYAWEHPEEFHLGFLAAPEFLRHPHIRLTVDTPDDLIFIDRLIRKLPEKGRPLPLGEYLPVAQGILNERDCKALADL